MERNNPHSWLFSLTARLAPAFREIMLLSIFVNLLALAVPVFVLQVYDRVVFTAGLTTLKALVIGMACIIIFDFALRQCRARVLQTVALRVDVQVGRRLFDKIVSLPLNTLEARPSVYWQGLFRDAEVIRNTLSGSSAVLICDLPFAVLFLALIFTIAEPIAWVLLLILPCFLIIAWRSAAKLAQNTLAERDSAQSRDSLIAEILAGRGTVKALALERAIRPLWEERHAGVIERSVERGAHVDTYGTLATTLTMMTTVTMTTIGAMAILNQNITIGALIAANMLSSRMLAPLNQLVMNWRLYASFFQAATRLGGTFSLPSERLESAVRMDRPKGCLSLQNLSFAYPGAPAPVIRALNLELGANGLHVLFGRNGSGKSTLLALMHGLYSPDAGRVLIDGADIAQFSRAEIAKWIGYVPQDTVLFAGSIRDNIALRVPEASDAEIIAAATDAGAHDFIVDLPDGYGTDIGESGCRLSTGQKQRLVIARALVGEPAVILLDEPSSALDRQAEVDLRNRLLFMARDRTIIVVSHAIALLWSANSVSLIENGRIAVSGPPAAILDQNNNGVSPDRGVDIRPGARTNVSNLGVVNLDGMSGGAVRSAAELHIPT